MDQESKFKWYLRIFLVCFMFSFAIFLFTRISIMLSIMNASGIMSVFMLIEYTHVRTIRIIKENGKK